MNMVHANKDQYKEKPEPHEGEALSKQTPEKMPVEEDREVRESREHPKEKEPRVEKELSTRMPPQLTHEEEKEAEVHAREISGLETDGKVERLLSLVETKGLVFANRVIKNLGSQDAFAVDSFHDTLAKDERYKHFLEK